MALELERHPDAAKNFAGIHVATVVSAGAEELVARALPSLLRYVAGVVVGTAAIEETLKKHDDAFKEEDKRYGIFPLSQGEFKVNSRTEISGLNSKSETDPGICKHPHPYDADSFATREEWMKPYNLSVKQKGQLINYSVHLYGLNPMNVREESGVIEVDTELPGGELAAKECFKNLTGRPPKPGLIRDITYKSDGRVIGFRLEGKSRHPKVDINGKETSDKLLEKITFK